MLWLPLSLNLLLVCTVVLIGEVPGNKVQCKTTLSKLQYINAIRDIMEGLIKSLATRQNIEHNRRLELHEYRKHHQNRLGKDVLVCRLCREIFVDPDKYFDHAHFHVVEKLQLAMTTSGNFPCQFCDGSFPNKYELYKHGYDAHLSGNLDRITTKPATTTTVKPNHADDLYCKICNITLLYPEKFYIHSFQHLQENMDLILNKTTTTVQTFRTRTKKTSRQSETQYDRKQEIENQGNKTDSEDGDERRGKSFKISELKKFKYYHNINNNSNNESRNETPEVLCTNKRNEQSGTVLKTENYNIVTNNRNEYLKNNQTNTKFTRNRKHFDIYENCTQKYTIKATDTKNQNRSYVKTRESDFNTTKIRQLQIQERKKLSSNISQLSYINNMHRINLIYNKSRRFLSVQDRHLKVQILKDLQINHKGTEKISPISKSMIAKFTPMIKSTRFATDIVQHIKQAVRFCQQKERKKDPDADIVCVVRYHAKAHLAEAIRDQQKKLVSLEQFLERTNGDIYRYFVVNDTIVNGTSPWSFIYTTRPYRTLPQCFITNPTHVYTRRYFPTSTYYINRNLYRNFNYSQFKYGNILDEYLKRVNKNSSLNYTSTHYINRNVYKNFNNSNNKRENIGEDYTTKKAKLETQTQLNFDRNITFQTLKRNRRKVAFKVENVQCKFINKEDIAKLPIIDTDKTVMSDVKKTETDIKKANKRVKRQLSTEAFHATTERINANSLHDNKPTHNEHSGWMNGRTNWTNMYPTMSRMIEKFFQTQVRIVRITKDLRTTKKVTLKPYAGQEEFTGDDFYGDSGEDRYERLMKKLRVTKVYVKCPYCPLRFYYNPERMYHIKSVHNLTDQFDGTTFDVQFKTVPGNQTRVKDEEVDEFVQNFQTFDYEYTTVSPPTQIFTTQSTTLDMDAFSAVVANMLKPEYLRGFMTTTGRTRNVDYMFRERTFQTTAIPLIKVEEELRKARDYLKNLVEPLKGDPDYTDSPEATVPETNDTPLTETKPAEVTGNDKEYFRGLNDADDKDNNVNGVKIEEITTENDRKVLQEGIVKVDEQLEKIREMRIKLSTILQTEISLKYAANTEQKDCSQSIGTAPYRGVKEIYRSERIKVGLGENVEGTRNYTPYYSKLSGGSKNDINGTSSSEEDYGEKFVIWGNTSSTLLRKTGWVKKEKTTRRTTQVFHPNNYQYTKFRKDVIKSKKKVCWTKRKWTDAYTMLYGTELNVTADEEIQQVLEILRRTRPVAQYYRYIFDYKRRLGPTAMSYEDSCEHNLTSPLYTTLSPSDIAHIKAQQYSKYMESIQALLTTPGPATNKSLTDYEKFLQNLADLKRAEQLKKEQAAVDYEEKVKRMEGDLNPKNTPLMINVKDMMKYQGEDEQQNQNVKEAFKFILKNDIRETLWNATKNSPPDDKVTYDDGYGELSYETRTQYVNEPTNVMP